MTMTASHIYLNGIHYINTRVTKGLHTHFIAEHQHKLRAIMVYHISFFYIYSLPDLTWLMDFNNPANLPWGFMLQIKVWVFGMKVELTFKNLFADVNADISLCRHQHTSRLSRAHKLRGKHVHPTSLCWWLQDYKHIGRMLKEAPC